MSTVFFELTILQALVANLLLSVSQTTADIKIVRQALQNCRERADLYHSSAAKGPEAVTDGKTL